MVTSGGSFNVTNSSFTNNFAAQFSGVISTPGGSIVITNYNSTFTESAISDNDRHRSKLPMKRML